MINSQASALKNIRVIDLTEGRGLFTGKVLADFGADVIKIEKPTGSDARKIGPFKDDIPGLETSLYFINYNANKKGLTLNLESPAGKEILKKLVSRADVVIEDFEVGIMKALGLDYPVLKEINHRLVMVSITGFGQTGLYSKFKAPDIVNFAMGGLMNLAGAANEPPVVAPCEQSYQSTSLVAAFSILAALNLRLKTGEGQYIDTSVHEAMSAFTISILNYSALVTIPGRTGSQFASAPARIYPCQDGFVHILVIRPNHWKIFLEVIGNPESLLGNVWYDSNYRAKNREIIDKKATEYTLKHTKADIVKAFQTRGVPCTPVNTPESLSQNPHEIARKFVGETEHQGIGSFRYLASPYRLSATPCTLQRPAPLLGQHNAEIYAKELGYSTGELDRLKAEGTI